MSTLSGTQIAAGVAQTALQAQQVARQRDREARRASDTRRLPELIEARLRALEEGDQADSSTSGRIDEQLPSHQSPPVQGPGRRTGQNQQQPDTGDEAPLYKHLDVQA
jgi:hypothetical protein